MSREVYAVIAFYALLAVDWLSPAAWLHAALALTAAAFLYCQVSILPAAKGIPAWRMPIVRTMLLASGLFEGLGAMIVLLAVLEPAKAASLWLVGAGWLLAAGNAMLWRQYRSNLEAAGVGREARGVIAGISPWLLIGGYVLPAGLLAAAVAVPATGVAPMALAGLAMVAGGASWKFVVITRAGHFQGFALPRLPQRGSGTRAAPPLAAALGD